MKVLYYTDAIGMVAIIESKVKIDIMHTSASIFRKKVLQFAQNLLHIHLKYGIVI